MARQRFPFGQILRLAASEWPRLLAGSGFLLIGAVASLLYPLAIRRVMDGALVEGDARGAIDRAALLMVVAFSVQAVAVSLRMLFFAVAGERVVTKLRGDLHRAILTQEIGFFDERRTGELTSRLASDTATLQSAVSSNISMMLRHATTVVGGIGFLFFTSPRLTLLMLSVVPPVAFGAVWYARRVRKLSRETQDALAAAGEVAEESIAGIRTVRSFTAEPAESRRYRNAVERAFDKAKQRVKASAWFMGAASFLGYGAASVVLWYGARLVVDGRMTLGALSSFLIYTLLVAFSLGAVAEIATDFARAGGAAERVFELLARTPKIPSAGGLIPERIDGAVALEDVSFSYPARADVEVLRGLRLSVAPGEVVALVGASGAGKSTIAQLITRLYDPTAGRVLLDGRDLKLIDPRWLREHVGVVSQEPTLFSCSVADNIRYGRPDATDEEIEAAAKAAHAHGFVTKFPEGYRTLVGERGVQLSGGQKQRVAIARAVLRDPRILILDEATSALDAESEHLVQEALESLMKGRTTLIIAHRLSTVRRADRVVVLDKGEVAQIGRHDALVQEEGIYRRLLQRQLA
jgi:ABC transporter fused permease/ATP-binding protein